MINDRHRSTRGLNVQQLLALANEIPWIMAPAIMIAATAIISIFVAGIRLSNPSVRAILAVLILTLSSGAMVMINS
jgi:hypothetical protein